MDCRDYSVGQGLALQGMMPGGREEFLPVARAGLFFLREAARWPPPSDKSKEMQFSAAPHGRRSPSNLRRSPQEDAASLNDGGGRKLGEVGRP